MNTGCPSWQQMAYTYIHIYIYTYRFSIYEYRLSQLAVDGLYTNPHIHVYILIFYI